MKTLFTCLFVSVVLLGFGQNTFKVRTSTGAQGGLLNQAIQLGDGSFVGVGSIYNDLNRFYTNIYLLKTDLNGNVIASIFVDTAGANNAGYSLTKTTDGGFALCGTFSNRMALVKFGANLTPQWQKEYPVSGGEAQPYKVLQTADGSYLMAGAIFNNDSSGSAGFIAKTDSSGNIMFAKRYFTYANNQMYSIAITADGNYNFLGKTLYTVIKDTAYIIKTQPDGTGIWARYLVSDSLSLDPADIKATLDSGVIITGEAAMPGGGPINNSFQFMMAKYNNAGNLLWSKHTVTGSDSGSYATGVAEDKDGGYIFGGSLKAFPTDKNYVTSYMYTVKTNAAGDLLWTKTFEPSIDGFTEISSLIRSSDGGYAACGFGYFPVAHDTNGTYRTGTFLYKWDSSFQICGETAGSVGTLQNFGTNGSTEPAINNINVSSLFTPVVTEDGVATEVVCSSSALPLQLLAFNASLQNKNVAVQWSTANEINTDHFIVERSNNATAFTALQQVAAKGNSANIQSYAATDLQPLSGTSYYRLKEVDNDGKITYSSIVPVTVLNNGVIIISPNPVKDIVKVVMQSAGNSSITVQVVDINGRIMAAQKASVTTGRNQITIPAASLAKGIYVLKVIENNAVQTVRFVKE